MSENRTINPEKGSISVYAIATVMCFLFILGGVFFSSSVIRKNQLNTLMKIKEIYAQEIGEADEITAGRNQIDTSSYIQNGLVVFYDAINNMGGSHSNKTKIWRDLSGNGHDAIYKGSGELTWEDKAYDFIGADNNYFESKDNITLSNKSRTIEIVYSLEEEGVENLAGFGSASTNALSDILNYNNGINLNVFGNSMDEGLTGKGLQIGKMYSSAIMYNTSNNTTSYYTDLDSKLNVTFRALNTGSTTVNLGIGKNASNNKNKRFKILSFRIYDRILTKAERKSNYNLDKQRYEVKEEEKVVTEPYRFEYTGALQTFTAPKTGKYQIQAAGASGSGGNKYGQTSLTAEGGKGAKIVATFNLEAGDTIDIVVGGQGTCTQATAADGTSGGGGGGTFLFKQIDSVTDTKYQFAKGSTNYETLLAVAGGGGSQDVGYKKVNSTGYPGQAANYKSPNNYTAFSTTTNAGTSSASVSGVMGITQFINYDAKGSFYTRSSGRAQGGYGGGGSQDDNWSYGGGWCKGTNTYQSDSWSLDTTAIGTDGDNEGNGYAIITFLPEVRKGELVKGSYTVYTDNTGSAYVPGGYCVVRDVTRNGKLDKNEVGTGLVISDKANDDLDNTKQGNQFVWVPVSSEQLTRMYDATNKRGNLYDFGTSSATKNPPTLIAYSATGYREPDIVTSYDGADSAKSSYFKAAISETMTGTQFKTQLEKEFDNMIKSVERYKGFYIGRYETGNWSASDINNVPKVQKGQTVGLDGVNWYYQYTETKHIKANSNVTTSMIWGCQFDRTLEWIAQTNLKNGQPDYSLLTDSRSWGNYTDSTGDAATNSGGTTGPQTSGKNEAWKKNNIYDLAGNAFDLTIEANNTYNRLKRGGHYGASGSSYSVSGRGAASPNSSTSQNSSRATLLINPLSMQKEPEQKEYAFAYTGAVQEWTVPVTGVYNLQVWGAEGGTNSTNSTATAGKGGYSQGKIQLNKDDIVYVYVGGQGGSATNTCGGFNGGGIRLGTKTNITNASGGGGATDIRISTDSLYNRVIVAGGGGGQGTSTGSGGEGGGTSGIDGKGSSTNKGKGGTQIAAGTYPSGDNEPASFGYGGGGPNGTVGAGGGRRMVWRFFRNTYRWRRRPEALAGYTQKTHSTPGKQEMPQTQQTGY